MSVGQPCMCGALDCERCHPSIGSEDDEPDPDKVAREMERARRRRR